MDFFQILSDIEKVDAEVYERFDTRRRVFKHLSGMGKAVTAATLPAMLGTMFRKAYGQTTGSLSPDIVSTLNLALSLEYLERYFYQAGIDRNLFTGNDLNAITIIRDDELGHIDALRTVLGTQAINDPTASAFDYTAGGKLNPFGSAALFLGNAQAFVLGATGAIVWLFDAQIGVQFGIWQVAKAHADLHILDLDSIGGDGSASVPQAQGGMEHDFTATHQLQLRQRARMVARLADLQIVERGNLVGADHERARMQACHGLGLGTRQAQCGRRRCFAWQRRFIEVGCDGLERQAEPAQQFAPVGRARGEDQAGRGRTW